MTDKSSISMQAGSDSKKGSKGLDVYFMDKAEEDDRLDDLNLNLQTTFSEEQNYRPQTPPDHENVSKETDEKVMVTEIEKHEPKAELPKDVYENNDPENAPLVDEDVKKHHTLDPEPSTPQDLPSQLDNTQHTDQHHHAEAPKPSLLDDDSMDESESPAQNAKPPVKSKQPPIQAPLPETRQPQATNINAIQEHLLRLPVVAQDVAAQLGGMVSKEVVQQALELGQQQKFQNAQYSDIVWQGKPIYNKPEGAVWSAKAQCTSWFACQITEDKKSLSFYPRRLDLSSIQVPIDYTNEKNGELTSVHVMDRLAKDVSLVLYTVRVNDTATPQYSLGFLAVTSNLDVVDGMTLVNLPCQYGGFKSKGKWALFTAPTVGQSCLVVHVSDVVSNLAKKNSKTLLHTKPLVRPRIVEMEDPKKIVDIDISPLDGKIIVTSHDYIKLILSSKKTLPIISQLADDPITSARFIMSEQKTEKSDHFITLSSEQCSIYKLESATNRPELIQRFQLAQGMAGTSMEALRSSEVFLSLDYLIVLRPSQFYMEVYRLARKAPGQSPLMISAMTSTIRPHHTGHMVFFIDDSTTKETTKDESLLPISLEANYLSVWEIYALSGLQNADNYKHLASQQPLQPSSLLTEEVLEPSEKPVGEKKVHQEEILVESSAVATKPELSNPLQESIVKEDYVKVAESPSMPTTSEPEVSNKLQIESFPKEDAEDAEKTKHPLSLLDETEQDYNPIPFTKQPNHAVLTVDSSNEDHQPKHPTKASEAPEVDSQAIPEDRNEELVDTDIVGPAEQNKSSVKVTDGGEKVAAVSEPAQDSIQQQVTSQVPEEIISKKNDTTDQPDLEADSDDELSPKEEKPFALDSRKKSMSEPKDIHEVSVSRTQDELMKDFLERSKITERIISQPVNQYEYKAKIDDDDDDDEKYVPKNSKLRESSVHNDNNDGHGRPARYSERTGTAVDSQLQVKNDKDTKKIDSKKDTTGNKKPVREVDSQKGKKALKGKNKDEPPSSRRQDKRGDKYDDGDEYVPKRESKDSKDEKFVKVKDRDFKKDDKLYSPPPPEKEYSPIDVLSSKGRDGGSQRYIKQPQLAVLNVQPVSEPKHDPAIQKLAMQSVQNEIKNLDQKLNEALSLFRAASEDENKREQAIENIVRAAMEKYVQEKFIKELKSQFNCLMSNNFNEVFEEQVVPSFEKYLTKVFEKITTVMDKGLRYYGDRIALEERKVGQLKDNFTNLVSQFMGNSKSLNKLTSELGLLQKDIVSNQQKDLSKRVGALEESVEKIAEKQDRMLDMLDKISTKMRVNEEDKKIDVPTSKEVNYSGHMPASDLGGTHMDSRMMMFFMNQMMQNQQQAQQQPQQHRQPQLQSMPAASLTTSLMPGDMGMHSNSTYMTPPPNYSFPPSHPQTPQTNPYLATHGHTLSPGRQPQQQQMMMSNQPPSQQHSIYHVQQPAAMMPSGSGQSHQMDPAAIQMQMLESFASMLRQQQQSAGARHHLSNVVSGDPINE